MADQIIVWTDELTLSLAQELGELVARERAGDTLILLDVAHRWVIALAGPRQMQVVRRDRQAEIVRPVTILRHALSEPPLNLLRSRL